MRSAIWIIVGFVLLVVGGLFLHGVIDMDGWVTFKREFPGRDWTFWAAPLLFGVLCIAHGISSRRKQRAATD